MTEPAPNDDPMQALLAETLRIATAEHDRAHMSAEAKLAAINNLLETLSPDQLMTLRSILRLNKGSRQFLDGQVAQILKIVHKIDPATGDDLLVH